MTWIDPQTGDRYNEGGQGRRYIGRVGEAPRFGGMTRDEVRDRAARQAATTAANNAYWASVGGFGPGAPAPAAPGSPPAPSPGLTSDQRSARALIQRTLDEYGLGQLGDQLWTQYLAGAPMEQIMLDLRRTPEWKAQFGVIDELARKGRAINERTVIDLRRSFKQQLQEAGVPSGFYDSNDDFDKMIAGEKSAAELAAELDMWKVVAAELAANPENSDTLTQLNRMYGITPDSGAFLAYVMDDQRALPLLQTQFVAGRLGAVAKRTGFGDLDTNAAESLAVQGVTENQAMAGFGELAGSRELFNPLDASEDVIDTDTQLAAVFSNDAAAKERIRRRAAKRVAEGAGGGSFNVDQRGVTGIGSASS